MKKIIAPIAITALLTLAACGDTQTRAEKAEAAEAAVEAELSAPIEMPPAIKDSRTYRCKDGSLIYVDFFADDKAVSFRSKKGGEVTRLVAEEAGKPFKAEGYTLTGSGKSVNVSRPGKGAQTCKS